MKENEEKAGNTSEQKSKIRERYKGIDQDLLWSFPQSQWMIFTANLP